MNNVIAKLRQACRHRKLYLYGAGMYGRTLCAFMQEQSIGRIEKFIISGGNEQDTVLGYKVITLEQYASQRTFCDTSDKDDLIIVAVSEKYSAEIARELENRKIYHYIMLTKQEWDIIDNATLFESVILQKNIAILMYHRIIDSGYNFWKLNVSPATFEKHIKYISENYNVLRLEENWNDIVKAEQKYLAITFDDGYVDNYRFALPILEKYHIPATIFVSTDLIDTDEMYWWDELEKMIIMDEYTGEFALNGVPYKVTDSDSRKKACITIRNQIKNMNPGEQRESMDELREALGVKKSVTSELRCVNTGELARMASSPVITIGGHTKSHLSMGAIHTEELLRSEIEESLTILEKRTGKEIEVFAYPYGGSEDRCDAADEILSVCGIKKTVSVKGGNININDRMYHMPRHMIFEGEDIEKKLRKIWGVYG